MKTGNRKPETGEGGGECGNRKPRLNRDLQPETGKEPSQGRTGGEARATLPVPAPWLVRGFGLYTRRYLARHFNSVRLDLLGTDPALAIPADKPLVVYLNHASWWDPLVALFLHQTFFPDRTAYAPIDAGALRKYGFFKRLGFFGVEQASVDNMNSVDTKGSRRGAAQFLRASREALSRPGSALWLTPQGQFSDPRQRPVRIKPGLAHLAARMPDATFLPLAIEYPFWEERRPEVLVRFGSLWSNIEHPTSNIEHRTLEGRPPCLPQPNIEHPIPQTTLETHLETAMDALASHSVDRAANRFRVLLSGRKGLGGVYQQWQRLVAMWQGKPYEPGHSQL